MRQVAEKVFLLDGRPKYAYNAYLVDNVLVDSGTRWAALRILRQLAGRQLQAHVVTHAHPDHQGASHAVCEQLNLPLLCGDGDADAIEQGGLAAAIPDNAVARWQLAHWSGPAHPVAQRLHEGDVVGGFTVLETPGHTPGSICLWRASDRVLIVGDVLNRRPLAFGGGLAEPPTGFSIDPALNRESIRRLAGLNPKIVCFGHGRPLLNMGQLVTFAADLPT